MPLADLDPAALLPPPELLARLQTPALVCHLDLARANVARIVALCGGDPDRWRPHVKTTKTPELWRELVAAGVRRFKCATTREADVLCALLDSEGVAGDVLLAQPLRGPGLARLGEVAEAHARQRLSVLCEDEPAVDEVPARVTVFVDVNVGMDRTGIPLADEEAIVAVARRAGARFRGVHAYDGHLHEDDPAVRRNRAHEVYDACVALLAVLSRRGAESEELVTSGTPTFRFALDDSPFHALEGTHHTVSPGTVVLHDARSEQQDHELGLVPAAYVLTRVVSHPAPDVATCDAGSKSLAAEAGDPAAVVVGHPGLVPLGPSEEHLPLRLESGTLPPRGTPLLLVPRHVCPTVNLADEIVLLDGGELVGVVPVRARGHETLVRR